MAELAIRRSGERYLTQADDIWTRHSFSYGAHYDPTNVGFGHLRAINEEWLAPGAGYAAHHHEDVEIVTWVLEGVLVHEDDAGSSDTIEPGVAQRLSAGTGVAHSERNASATEPLRFLQIMLTPDTWQLAPDYAQASVAADTGGWLPTVSVHQSGARLLIARLTTGERLALPDAALRHLHVARGAVTLADARLEAGDSAQISDGMSYDLGVTEPSDVLVWLMTDDSGKEPR